MDTTAPIWCLLVKSAMLEVRVSWEVVRTDDSIPVADWVVTETGGVEVAYRVDGERTGIEASGS